MSAASSSSSGLLLAIARNGLLATVDGVELDATSGEDSLVGDVASQAESEAESSVVEPTWNVAGRRKLFGAAGVVDEAAVPEPDSKVDGRSIVCVDLCINDGLQLPVVSCDWYLNVLLVLLRLFDHLQHKTQEQ